MRKLILLSVVLFVGCNEQPQPVQQRSVKVKVDNGKVDINIRRQWRGPPDEQPMNWPLQGN